MDCLKIGYSIREKTKLKLQYDILYWRQYPFTKNIINTIKKFKI